MLQQFWNVVSTRQHSYVNPVICGW